MAETVVAVAWLVESEECFDETGDVAFHRRPARRASLYFRFVATVRSAGGE